MTAEQIIKQIKLHPVLYDSRILLYRDYDARNDAWEDIARKLNSSVDDVKTKWAKLRNSFTNALKRRYKKNTPDSILIMPWKFQKQMEFLIPYLKYQNKQMRSNISADYVKDESMTSVQGEFNVLYDRPISPKSSPKYVSPIEDDIESYSQVDSHESRGLNTNLNEFVEVVNSSSENKYKSAVEMDENDCFFLSMSKMLKKLPQQEQADIKFKLHKVIYETEKRHLKKSRVY